MINRSIKIFLIPVTLVLLLGYFLIPDKENDNIFERDENKRESEYENPAARREMEYLMTRNPVTKKIPDNIRVRETEFSETIPERELTKSNSVSSLDYHWNSIGPMNVGGRTRDVEMDIRNTNTLLAGGVSGGLFKSIDRGDNWYRVSSKSSVYGVTAITQDIRPGKENNWYYGTGEFSQNGSNTASKNGAVYYGNGIFYSRDNGESWSVISVTRSDNPTRIDKPFKFIYRLKIDPASMDTTKLYAAAASGIYKITSQRGSFFYEPIIGDLSPTGSAFTDLDISAGGIIYAAISPTALGADTIASGAGFYRSEDGKNWMNITPAVMPPNTRRIVLDIYDADDDVVYVLAETPNTGATGHSLWRYEYDTLGGSWQNLTSSIPDSNWGAAYSSQNSYDMVVSVKPDDENYVFIGGTNLYRSTDGFKSMNNVDIIGGYGDGGVIGNSWVDQHKIIYSYDNPNEIFVGNDGGVRRTVNVTADKVIWQAKNTNYNTTQFYGVDIVEEINGDSHIIGGLQDRDVWMNDEFDKSKPWQRIKIMSDGSYCEFTKNVFPFYVSGQYANIFRMDTLGPFNESIAAVVNPKLSKSSVLFINPFILDPNDQNVMYLASAEGIWRNSDLSEIPTGNGNQTDINWELLKSTDVSSKITSLGVSRFPGHILYYGTVEGEVFKLENSNVSEDGAVEITSPGFPRGYVSSIYVDPDNADNIIITFSNYGVLSIFSSIDAGETWQPVSGNLEQFPDGSGAGPSVRWVNSVKIDNNQIYFAGTSTGLYSTTQLNGNNTEWIKEGNNEIGNAVISMIKTRNSDGTVVVSSLGSGVYHTKIGNSITSVKDNALAKDFNLSQNYPNPFNPSTKINYSVPVKGNVKLTVYDLLGRKVTELVNEIKPAGKYSVNFDAGELASGTYIYRLKAGNFSISRKMILVK